MKQFGKILKFELKGYLKNKVFTGVTIFLVVAIAVAMFIPNIISALKSGTTPPKDLPVMLVYAEDETLSETVKEYFAQAFTGYHVKVADGTPDDIKSQITSGSVECAFVLNSPSSYTYYVNNLNMRDATVSAADAKRYPATNGMPNFPSRKRGRKSFTRDSTPARRGRRWQADCVAISQNQRYNSIRGDNNYDQLRILQ